MRWQGLRRSQNVDDRRGLRTGSMAVGGGLGGLVLALVWVFLGGDPSVILEGRSTRQNPTTASGGSAQKSEGASSGSPRADPKEQALADFISSVLGSTEDVWGAILKSKDGRYSPPTLVLFTDLVQSACGTAKAATGPFYCPPDHKVYIDLGFYQQLSETLGAPGDFAQAYVVAHEVGHHVQNLLGVLAQANQMKEAAGSTSGANEVQVRVELQADCLAGVWAFHANKQHQVIEEGDVEEALNAASAVGDDTLQRRSQGRVVPDSFTHGSSEQRATWFRRGLETGSVEKCDTFSDREL